MVDSIFRDRALDVLHCEKGPLPSHSPLHLHLFLDDPQCSRHLIASHPCHTNSSCPRTLASLLPRLLAPFFTPCAFYFYASSTGSPGSDTMTGHLSDYHRWQDQGLLKIILPRLLSPNCSFLHFCSYYCMFASQIFTPSSPTPRTSHSTHPPTPCGRMFSRVSRGARGVVRNARTFSSGAGAHGTRRFAR
jgi:hypothetical protein